MPGLANRYLMPKVKRVYLHFEETQKYFRPHPSQKIQGVGFPLREEMESRAFKESKVLSHALPQETEEKPFFSILVLGGSQGATSINDLMVELWKEHAQEMQGISVIHQTGFKDYPRVFKQYGRYGFALSSLSPSSSSSSSSPPKIEVHAYLHSPFVAYSRAHLVICRAGAGTLAELAAQQKVALLLPLAHAANDHQKKNALYFKEAGAASMIEAHHLNVQSLLKEILFLKENPQKRQAYHQKIGLFYKKDVAKKMAEDLFVKW